MIVNQEIPQMLREPLEIAASNRNCRSEPEGAKDNESQSSEESKISCWTMENSQEKKVNREKRKSRKIMKKYQELYRISQKMMQGQVLTPEEQQFLAQPNHQEISQSEGTEIEGSQD